MAEVPDCYNNCLPFPIHGLPYVVVFPILDADGDLVTGAAGLDSEVSGDCNTFANCVNEAQEIPTSSGIYYLALTAAEMGNQVVTVQVKTSTSGAKTTVLTLYPMVHCGVVRTGTSAGGSSSTIVLDAGASTVDQAYAGHVIAATIDGTLEVRMIYQYVGSTKTASVHPNWVTASPDADDTFEIYNLGFGFMPHTIAGNIWGNVQGSVGTVAGYVSGSVGSVAGNVGGNVVGSVGSVTAGVTLANDAITAAKFDESTAFPLKSADSGSTAVARTGADSDTLETLSDQIDGVSVAASVADIVTGILAGTIEGTLTLAQVLRVLLAEAAGITTGSRTTSIAFRDQADTKDRIAGTMDSTGNRTAVVLNVT